MDRPDAAGTRPQLTRAADKEAPATTCLPRGPFHIKPGVTGLTRGAEECLYVGGEFGVVLEQETVRRVRVDLHCGLGDQAR